MRLKIQQDSSPSRRTYLRIRDVSHLLKRPSFKITMERQTLGPNGWGNEPHQIVADQRLADGDLWLTLADAVVNHIPTGKSVLLEVPELGISEAMFWPSLKPSQAGTGATRVADEDSIRLNNSPDRSPSAAPDPGPDPASGRNEVPPPQPAAASSGADDAAPGNSPPPADPEPIVEPQPASRETPRDPVDRADPPSPPPPESPPPPAPPNRRMQIALATMVFLVGVAVGSGSMYFVDRDEISEARRLKTENGYLRNFAFGPLANVLVPLPARSPQGVDPNQKVNVLQPDRARSFWNVGSEARNRGQQPESLYWYKQAVKLCESDSLTYLADAYFHGEVGGNPDPETGFQLMRCASALGNETARDTLSRLIKSRAVPYAPIDMGETYQRTR